jgi:hypothetical protein
MEGLYADGRIVLRDLHSVYEALFITAATSFEVFLEEHFFSILTEKTKYKKNRKVVLRVKSTSVTTLREILHQGKDYLTWMPFDHTEARARLYMKDGRPFSDLDGGAKSKIKTIHLIRNAIAHKSKHSKRLFDEKVIGTQALLSVEKTPSGYLRAQVSAAPVIIRFEVYMQDLAAIAKSIC